ncbi:MAG: hypothetical protein WC272_01660 [Sulfurimonas sp.]|jgi:hypothetical protein
MAIKITINQINATDDEVKNLNKILPFSEKRHELRENNISFSVINQSQEFFMTNEQNKKENIEKGLILDVKNLNESDIEKTIKFLAGNIKDNRSDEKIIAAEELYNEKARFFRKTNNEKTLPKKTE